ncbi:restriction endonuclease subunit S [Eubacterium sp. AM18-26]|nr:restriction endonuclease subunit S [Eubacterium sp. AM18-26]
MITWEQRKLEEIYQNIGNAFVGTAYVDTGHFYLESNNIKDGQINRNNEVFINDEFYERQKDKWLHTGDMVMVQSGHVGHTAVIPEELDNSAAHALIMFRNPKIEIEPYFLNYQYQTIKSKRKINNITTGNTIKHILASDMYNFIVDVSDIEEQQQIANYFLELDHLITLHQRKYNLCNKVKVYAWEQRKLSELVQIERGGSPRPIEAYITDAPNGLNWVKIGDAPVQGHYITKTAEKIKPEGLSKTRQVQPGDLILSNSMSFGKPYIMGIDGCIHDGWLLIRDNKKAFDLTFLYHLLGTPQMLSQYKSLAAGSTVNNLNKELVGGTIVTIPNLDEQQVLGQYLESLDNLITLHQRKKKYTKKPIILLKITF